MRISKWGNSLAVRIPAAVVEALDLKAGDEVEVVAANDRSFEVAKKLNRETALQRLRQFRGLLKPEFKFDRDELYDR